MEGPGTEDKGSQRKSFIAERGDQPDEILLRRLRQIACTRNAPPPWMGVVAADDLPPRAAQGARQTDMFRGIDFKAIIGSFEIGRRMQCDNAHDTGLPHPLNETATFAGQGGSRFCRHLVEQRIGKDERKITLHRQL